MAPDLTPEELAAGLGARPSGPRPSDGLVVPEALAAAIAPTGPEGRRWLRWLPDVVDDACERWSVVPDLTAVRHGRVSLVVPVRGVDGARAVLKVGWPHPEAEAEPDALHAWGGRGAARLLGLHRESHTLLLEELDADRDLVAEPSAEAATEAAAALLPLLHAAEVPEVVRSVAELAPEWTEVLDGARRGARRPVPKRRVEEALDLLSDLTGDGPPARLLHWDLHHGNVLRGLGPREDEWLAIDPKPLAGDPAAEPLALLRNRAEAWSEIEAPEREVQARLARVCSAGALDLDRARAWTLLRATVDHVRAVVEGPDDDVAVLDLVGRALASPPVL